MFKGATSMINQDWSPSSNFKTKLVSLTPVIGFYSDGSDYNSGSTTTSGPKIN